MCYYKDILDSLVKKCVPNVDFELVFRISKLERKKIFKVTLVSYEMHHGMTSDGGRVEVDVKMNGPDCEILSLFVVPKMFEIDDDSRRLGLFGSLELFEKLSKMWASRRDKRRMICDVDVERKRRKDDDVVDELAKMWLEMMCAKSSRISDVWSSCHLEYGETPAMRNKMIIHAILKKKTTMDELKIMYDLEKPLEDMMHVDRMCSSCC